MKRFFSGRVLFGLLFLPLWGETVSLLALQQDGSPAPGPPEIVVTHRGVQLRVTARPLHEVLESVRQVSGISFSFPKTMAMVPVTATIEAPDWPTAVRQLLRPFNTAEVWEPAGQYLRRVILLDCGQARPLVPMRVPLAPAETGPPREDSQADAEDAGTPDTPPGAVPLLPQPPAPPPTQEAPTGPPPPDAAPLPTGSSPSSRRP